MTYAVQTAPSILDTSHPGLQKQLREYTRSELSNQIQIQRRLRSLLGATNPLALSRIDDWMNKGDAASIPPVESSVSGLVQDLPVTAQQTFLLLDALESALPPESIEGANNSDMQSSGSVGSGLGINQGSLR